MERTSHSCVLCMVLAFAVAGSTWAQDDVADIPSQRLAIAGDPNMSYFLVGPRNAEVPSRGHGLLVILPGGDGGPDLLPFVKRVFKHALGDDFLVAQPIAVKWSLQQEIVWPTKNDALSYAKFSTEQFVTAVIKAVQGQQQIDPSRIFMLSWSSSGPAAYAVSLQADSPVVGSYIAMSVFQPEKLGSLAGAVGHAYFIDHCPQDRICPFRMALEARQSLAAAGAKVQLNAYAGGHGWQGDVYPRIAKGIRWLQDHARPAAPAGRNGSNAPADRSSPGLVLQDDFEQISEWKQGASVAGVEYAWDQRQAHRGKASISLKKAADRSSPAARWYRTVPCSGHKTLDVSAWVKAQNARKAAVDLQFRDSSGRGLGHQSAICVGAREDLDPPANHDWKQYDGIVEIPTGTRSVIVILQVDGPGAVWFDTLAIQEKTN